MRLIYFLFLFLGGLALIIYREKVQRVSGNFAFAEKWLGVGGTFTLYLLIGIGFIIFSVLYITGTLDAALQGSFGRFLLIPKQ